MIRVNQKEEVEEMESWGRGSNMYGCNLKHASLGYFISEFFWNFREHIKLTFKNFSPGHKGHYGIVGDVS